MPPSTSANAPNEPILSIGLSLEECRQLETQAVASGFKSLSGYVRYLHQKELRDTSEKKERQYAPEGSLAEFYRTDLGAMFHGNSLRYLLEQAPPASVDLVMTSPPFGLVRKKSYGNEDADQYCEWFRPFAAGVKRVLKDSGSFVIDIGGAWKPGTPTRSLYHFELLIMLCREFGFHLCLEHFWWNPSKLPSPAEWVNVRRVRPKDAVNCVWWLSKTPWPKASNRRVLTPYSDSMRGLLKTGYRAKLRPSGHDISNKFSRDNGGAVPPNLLAIANTESNGAYQEYCRKNDIPIHPARFPAQLPEYFIRMLTDPNDMVVDPFGGSCTTGHVAERLGRQWACIEMDESFLRGARGRFVAPPTQGDREAVYAIHAPCAGAAAREDERLPADGGRQRAAPCSSTSAPSPA